MTPIRVAFNILVFMIVLSSSYGSSIANKEDKNYVKTENDLVHIGHSLRNACTSNPCKNGGICKLIEYDVVCECPPPYKGERCEEDVCTPNPCLYNGTCEIVDGRANCTCLHGIQGEFCDKACFHGSTIVLTRNGGKEIKDLQLDEEVASGFLPDGSFTYSPVIAFLHKDINMESSFIQLTTDAAETLLITDKHLIFRRNDKDVLEAVHADKIKIGDRVYSKMIGEKPFSSVVTNLKSVVLNGIYSPLTLDGTIVVNNILASCYAEADSHTKSHIVFWPMRVHFHLKSAFKSFDWLWNLPMTMAKDVNPFEDISTNKARVLETHEFQGVHWYAKMLIWLTASK